jgi:aldose 1-epimerase
MNIKSTVMMALAASAMLACQQPKQEAECQAYGLCPEKFGTTEIDGKPVKLYTLVNKNGLKAQFTNLGAKLVSMYAPDKDGNFGDVVLGYATMKEYAECDNEAGKGESFFGATIGRYGNRIANGKFSIGDTEYQLCINENGITSLHGGFKGFFATVWDANQVSDSKIEFTYVSVDGEMGYPGTLTTKLTYELCDCNSLVLTYSATTDKPTVVNLTHHSFFNLAGDSAATINDHVMMIPAENITPVDERLIPTGELMPVAGTAFDFNTPRVIGDSLSSEHPQMKLGNGYDHNWVLSSEADTCGLRLAAKVYHPATGRQMTVMTTEPGIQFYGGNFLNSTQVGKCGKAYPFRSAFCLETQHFPDSPNHDNFPSTLLEPGQEYKHVCVYKFDVIK